MTGKAQLRDLMISIGPLLDLAEVAEFERENAWTLAVDEETVLLAEWDEPGKRLVLSIELGTPHGGDRLSLYEQELVYNGRWMETGGVRLALDAPGGQPLLVYDLAAAGLDLPRLQGVIGNFLDCARAWREIVAGGQEGDGPPQGPIDRFSAGMIRG